MLNANVAREKSLKNLHKDELSSSQVIKALFAEVDNSIANGQFTADVLFRCNEVAPETAKKVKKQLKSLGYKVSCTIDYYVSFRIKW